MDHLPNDPANNDGQTLSFNIGGAIVATDYDGDDVTLSNDAVTITVEDDIPSVVANNIDDNSVIAVTSDALITDTDATQSVADLFSYTPTYGADGQGAAAIQSYGIDLIGDVDAGAATVGIDSGFTSGGDPVYLYQVGGSVVASTAAVLGDVTVGNTAFTISVDPVTGALTLEQSGVLDHTDDGSSTDTQLVLADGLINATYSVTIEDGDEDTATATQVADLGGNIAFNDDVPSENDANVTVQVDEDELPGGITDGDLIDTNESGMLNPLVDFGNDTPGSFAFDMTGFVDPMLTSGGDPVVWGVNAAGALVGYTGGDINDTASHVIVVELVESGGNWNVEVTLEAQVDHLPNDPANNDNQTLSFNIGGAIVATDYDGDEVTLSNDAVTITVEDDIPTIFTPQAKTDVNMTGDAWDDAIPNTGSAVVAGLINDANNDNVGEAFIGADGFGSLVHSGGSNGDLLQSGGENVTSGGLVIYLFGYGTDTLTATTSSDNSDVNAVVFTVTLDEGAVGDGSDANYEIEFFQALDDGSGTVLSDFGAINPNNYDWVGFTSDGDLFDGIDNDGEDILITAYNPNTGVAGTVNMSASDIGSNNQWIDGNEAIRIDFVTDGTGSGDEKVPQGYSFDGHYLVTNASFSIIDLQGGGAPATVKITLFNDDDTGNIKDLDGAIIDIDLSSIVITDDLGNDVTLAFAGNITDNGDGTVTISGLLEDYNVAFEGVTSFNAFEVAHDGGNSFSLGEFGFNSEVSGDDIPLSFEVTATDGDGDAVTADIDVVVSPAAVTPIVLDLDGGGNEFVSADAGVAYDYDGDGVKTKTAWIAAGSAILFHDTNGDGVVSDASEFVFGHDGMTDMEAVLKLYDSNNNGQLDQGDAEYGKFGVWMDDGDAEAEDGEFASLSDLHITSIDLVSDGIQTVEGDGDVTVYGTSTFSIDGVVAGAASDTAFALGSDVEGAMMEALLALAPEEGAQTVADDGVEAASGRSLPEAVAIVKDVLEDGVVDAMLDNITGEHGAPAAKIAGLEGAALTHIIDGGAFVFDNNHAAAMDDHAAAVLAAVHA